MDLKQYVQDAIRTESKIEKITTNPQTLKYSLQALIAVGTILDYIKKNVFYGKPIDSDKYTKMWEQLSINTAYLGHQDAECMDSEHSAEIPINPRVFHAIIGAITEAVELAEALQKGIDNQSSTIDLVNLSEEFFDLDWYKFIFCDAAGIDPQSILDTGFAKLKVRFPEKFNSSQAINRNTDEERKILEQITIQPTSK